MTNKKVLEIGFPKRVNKAWGYEDILNDKSGLSSIMYLKKDTEIELEFSNNNSVIYYLLDGVIRSSGDIIISGKILSGVESQPVKILEDSRIIKLVYSGD